MNSGWVRSKTVVLVLAVVALGFGQAAMGAVGFTDLGSGSTKFKFSSGTHAFNQGDYKNLAQGLNDSATVAGQVAVPYVSSYHQWDFYVGSNDTDPPAPFFLGETTSYVADVNNSGSYAWLKANEPYRDGTALAVLDGGDAGVHGINNNGDVVGQVLTNSLGGLHWEACVWPAGGTAVVTLDGIYKAGNYNTVASGINDLGQICGTDADPAAPGAWNAAAFVTAPTDLSTTTPTAVRLPKPGAEQLANATAINSDGWVVGITGNDQNMTDMIPFVWKPTTANGTTGASTALGAISGDTVDHSGSDTLRAFPYALNDDGIAVGISRMGSGFGIWSNAAADHRMRGYIEDDYCGYGGQEEKAFIWNTDTNEAVYLETLLSQADQDAYHLLFATDINNDAAGSYDITVMYKKQADIDGGSYGAAPIYAALLTGVEFGSGPALVPGDCDGDGDVDLTDLAILASNYGATEPPALAHGDGDFDDDGDVDLTDLAILANNWGFGTMTAVPEPASMSLLALAGLPLLRRRS